MLKLYRYDSTKQNWIFVDYGVLANADNYAQQGYLVVFPTFNQVINQGCCK